jgi:hypothetical protein
LVKIPANVNPLNSNVISLNFHPQVNGRFAPEPVVRSTARFADHVLIGDLDRKIDDLAD